MTKSDSEIAASAPSAAAFLMAQMLQEWRAYRGQTVVVKIGGNSIADDDGFLEIFAEQMAFLHALQIRLVLIHGAGPQIDSALKAAGFSTAKGADGRRPSTPAMMQVIEGAMVGLNGSISETLKAKGCTVFQGTGEASRTLLRTRPLKDLPPEEDRTGFPQSVDRKLLLDILADNKIVLLPSLGADDQGRAYNVNADDYAMAISVALKAHRLILATNVAGVLDAQKRLIPRLMPSMLPRLIDDKVITGGMIPKVESAMAALQGGVGGIAIVNAHARGALMAEVLTPTGCGTLIAPDAPKEASCSPV